MHFHLIVTDECNLCCSYCRAKAFEETGTQGPEADAVEIDPELPVELSFDLDGLYEFLGKDPSPTLTFYGGEPLLRADLVEEIMQRAPGRFMIQTNGLLLDRLPPGIVNRFSTILLSIDGPEGLTDAHRGNGTYRAVTGVAGKIRSRGYTGELIARMTVNEDTDIVSSVLWLAENPDFSFSSIHWQIDANFSRDYQARSFGEWVTKSYNPGIRTLVSRWVDHMEATGKVLRWYPFLDPVDDLLHERSTRLRCGSGYANYSIMTDGNIAPCPVMTGMSGYYVGHISDADPLQLPTVEIGGECRTCGILGFCGGRCLYSNITEPWGPEERRTVCSSVENLHGALSGVLPRIRDLISGGVIRWTDFSHEKFNGCEIIP